MDGREALVSALPATPRAQRPNPRESDAHEHAQDEHLDGERSRSEEQRGHGDQADGAHPGGGQVLQGGAMPLTLLEDHIKDWVSTTKAQRKPE